MLFCVARALGGGGVIELDLIVAWCEMGERLSWT